MDAMDAKVQELSRIYSIPADQVRESLHRFVSDGFHMQTAERLFHDWVRNSGHLPASPATARALSKFPDCDCLPGGPVPSIRESTPDIDRMPDPHRPGESVLSPCGILLSALMDVWRKEATREECLLVRRAFARISENGYGMSAHALQMQVLSRSSDDIRLWVHRIYDRFLTGDEIARIVARF